MRSLRIFTHGPLGRFVAAATIVSSLHAFAEPANYLTALEVERQKEAQIREIARKMNVDPEFLLNAGERRGFDFKGLFDWVQKSIGIRSEANVVANTQPESVRESIARVKERYALVAADTTLAKVAQLVELANAPAASRGKKKGQIKAEMQSVLRLIDKDFLPAVKDGLPGAAASRDRDMRNALKDLRKDVKDVLNEKDAFEDANLDATLAKLKNAVSGKLTLRNNGPRWTKDPFPLKDTYKSAPVQPAGPSYGSEGESTKPAETPAVVSNAATSAPSGARLSSNAAPAEVAALAAQLGTPAKIFTYVHDRIGWESYSGVAKGSLGTLKEAKGNDWDQAILLRDLLAAQGYDARLEWGRVTLPIQKAMNLVGTEDPLQAGNLLATAGFDGLLLTAKGAPIAVQMTHVWVRAFIPYIPNRGAKAGTPDTWVRMDPSFKRYEYQPGIAINGKVVWNQDNYLNVAAATLQQPSQFYGDQIWSYIRSNNIDCINLSQVAKLGKIKADNFPFVPSTLTTKIDEVRGVSATPPADQVQNVTINIVSETGAVVGTFNTAIADLWGKKLSVTFPPATPDDAATIAAYGGLFNTPSYLVKLKPVFSLDDQPVAEGFSISAGAALDMNLTFRQPNVADDFAHHQVVAGETHTLVFDAGTFPDDLVQSRIERLKALTAGNAPEDAIRSEELYLVGLRYMQHVDDGIAFATGVRWQRAVKRVFEANVRRQIDITYNLAGAPLRLKPAENNIDVARLVVGIVPINNDQSNKAEALALAGLQSSFLEGAIWEEMESVQGISAAKALLLAKAAGQQLHTVTSSNVDAVLAQTNLASDVEAEIRGSVAQGRVARIPSSNITLGNWTGTGYILQDPRTGAATYPISGGLAGGSSTGSGTSGAGNTLGGEGWTRGGGFLGSMLEEALSVMGDQPQRDPVRPPSTTQSDPVNVSNGNMFITMSDLSLATRVIPVKLDRTYNSRSNRNGPFGFGWTFSYGEQLLTQADGSLLWIEPDGTEHPIARDAGGSFIPPPGKFIAVTSSGGGHVLRLKNGVEHVFDAAGNLVEQRDLNGNTLRVNRDTTGLPVSIIDAAGRTVVTFTVSSGKIVEVTDIGGRKVVYGYDGDDLVSVVDTAGKTWTYHYDLAHNMTQRRDPLGNAQSYGYDTDDRMFHHVDSGGAEEFFFYDIAGRSTALTDRRGGDRLIRYDDLGRAILEADPAGNVTTATFDAANNRTSVTNSRGKATLYEFDALGNVTRQTNPDGGVLAMTYDSASRPLTSTDPIGNTTTNSYDSQGNLLQSSQTVNGAVQVTTYTYDTYGQPLTITDPNGGTTTMAWTAEGHLSTRKDPGGGTTTVVNDVFGRVTSFFDAAGNETRVTYDGRDRMLTARDAFGVTTTFTYDDAGRRTSISNPRGTVTYTFDSEGRTLSVNDFAGAKSSMIYNAAGDVVSRTDARGNTTRYEYDLAGRVTRMVDAAGGVWTYGYCASLGSSSGSSTGPSYCEMVDPNGGVLRQQFDTNGRVTAVTDALGHSTLYEYDKAGRKTLETDAAGNGTRYGYDGEGRLISVRTADGSVTEYTYDGNGNKLTQKDARGNVWSYTYDGMNRLTAERDPLNRTTSYTYDVLGNVKTHTDGNGKITTYEYAVRRPIKVTYADGSTDTYTYDALGRRIALTNANATIAYTYDAMERVRSVTNQRHNISVQYDYDAAGNLAKMVTPRSTVQYAYDGKNRLSTITDSLFGVFRFGYDSMDRRTSLQHPNGIVTSYDYDKGYRLTSVAAKDAAGALVDAWSYQYDAVGNRTSKTDLSGKAETYRYDPVYRLAEANYADGTFEKFGYDGAGNRTSLIGPVGTTTYDYDVANQMIRAGADTFTYDNNGNLKTKISSQGNTNYTYDFNNRLVDVNGPAGRETNLYSADGQRIDMAGASIENGQVRVMYDLAGNPILDWGTDGQVWTYRLYGPGVDEALAEYRRTNNRTTYLHQDAIGSVTAVSNTSGQVLYRATYRAFGQMARTADPQGIVQTRLGYTGRETSVGGLMHNRARHYDTSSGRFLQKDPVPGDRFIPPSLHRYVYTINNPVRFTDPSGEVIPIILGVLALAWAIAAVGMFLVWLFCWIAGEDQAAAQAWDAFMFCSLIAFALWGARMIIMLIWELGVWLWSILLRFMNQIQGWFDRLMNRIPGGTSGPNYQQVMDEVRAYSQGADCKQLSEALVQRLGQGDYVSFMGRNGPMMVQGETWVYHMAVKLPNGTVLDPMTGRIFPSIAQWVSSFVNPNSVQVMVNGQVVPF